MLKKKGFRIAILALAGAAILCIAACVALILLTGPTTSFMKAAGNPVKVGSALPGFSLRTLEDEPVSPATLRGKPAVVSFGATWCSDCAREAPILQQLHEIYATELEVVWIDSKEESSTVESYISGHHYTFATALDLDGKVAQQYSIWAIPTLYFVDRDGVVRALFIEQMNAAQLTDALEKIGIQIKGGGRSFLPGGD